MPSLSARRAWIEILVRLTIWNICLVALRKESVDRNSIGSINKHNVKWSLSARRAWIEISTSIPLNSIETVALRKESVDRNLKISADS